ncbi:MAG: response regulator transcription factor, partial [Planctomycetota bacterium]
IEDDPLLSECLGRYLSQAGMRVHVARTGAEALRLGDAGKYSALLVDAGLPDASGLTVVGRLRERGVQSPAIVITGYSDGFEEAELNALGVRRMLAKPFSLVELKTALAGVLDAGPDVLPEGAGPDLEGDAGVCRPG